jgi:serine/threonine protein kinase
MTVKISDFGLSKTKEHTSPATTATSTTDVLGSIPWAAPEYLTFKRINERNEKGDVFSFGVIVWELVTGQTPWKAERMNKDDIKDAVIEGVRLMIPPSCPEELEKVITQCWKSSKNSKFSIFNEKEPADRPPFETLIDVFKKMMESAKLEEDLGSEAEHLLRVKEQLQRIKEKN